MELARYHVRTPLVLWLVHGALTAFCVLVVGALVFVGHAPPFMVLLAVTLASVVVAFWFAMSAYRVGGGRNLIRFYADRIEIPGPTQRRPMVFGRDSQLLVRDVSVQYRFALTPIATVKRGKVIELRNAAQRRQLSTLVLEDRTDEAALVADLHRFVAGEPAIGRAAHDAPPPRTEYDDRIDRELAQLE